MYMYTCMCIRVHADWRDRNVYMQMCSEWLGLLLCVITSHPLHSCLLPPLMYLHHYDVCTRCIVPAGLSHRRSGGERERVCVCVCVRPQLQWLTLWNLTSSHPPGWRALTSCVITRLIIRFQSLIMYLYMKCTCTIHEMYMHCTSTIHDLVVPVSGMPVWNEVD